MKRLKGAMDLERWAPGLFVAIGVGMIVLSALDYLTSGVSGTFAVLGTALIIFGGLLRSIEGRFKVGPQGIEATIRARTEVAAAVIEKKKDPDDAKALLTAMDWATDYRRWNLRRYLGERAPEGGPHPRGTIIVPVLTPGRGSFPRTIYQSERITDEDLQDLLRRLDEEKDDEEDPPAGAPVPTG